MKKKIDDRIINLLQSCISTKERSMFIIVGDNGREQIPNINYLLNQTEFSNKQSALWMYKKDLGFSNHCKKKINKIKGSQNKGLYNESNDNNLETFVSTTDVKFRKYIDSHLVLGNTYNMLILQDFEAITPNLLCRTIETVKGGGCIIFLFRTMDSLEDMYNLSMDSHNKYKTSTFKRVDMRFNRRFISSLVDNKNCLVIDQELNILAIDKHHKLNLKKWENNNVSSNPIDTSTATDRDLSLNKLKQELNSSKGPIADLIKKCLTLDQAKCVNVSSR